MEAGGLLEELPAAAARRRGGKLFSARRDVSIVAGGRRLQCALICGVTLDQRYPLNPSALFPQ